MKWLPVRGSTKYEVSSEGIVRNVATGRFLSLATVGGYKRVHLRVGRGFRQFMVHRLVYEAFVSKIPKGKFINHKNLIKRDNRLENLEMVTPLENTRHFQKAAMSIVTKEYKRTGKFVNYKDLLERDFRPL